MKKIINDCFCMEVLCQKTAKNILSTFLLFIIYFSMNAQNGFAFNRKSNDGYFQQKKEQRITVKVKNEKLSAVLAKIEKQIQYVFVYSDDDVNSNQRISIEVKAEDLNEVLESIAKLANLSFEIINDKIILKGRSLGKNTGVNNLTGNDIISHTVENDKISRPVIIITGKVTDEERTGIPGVSVTVKGTSIGSATNTNGNYNIALPDNISNPVLVFTY
ncbi:MAG TPA: secretin and TonB N-terminal domain-containing protein, partial [Chitinophagaceae bacterium]|nr:secretin and TonB N-terminal domain-containing protein [Chitinophagaceae bacterium]